MSQATVFILSASSDIGRELASRYLRDGYKVIGTYRTQYKEDHLQMPRGVVPLKCDIEDDGDIENLIGVFEKDRLTWDIFVSSVGELSPIGLFFNQDFAEWERSFHVNATLQLKVLHALYPFRATKGISHVALFAGGGTNNPFRNYSAYCLGKIALIKMCELIDDEAPDLNVFISGPGWTRTKGHEATIKSGVNAGENYETTKGFLESGEQGTSFDDIYDHIRWCCRQGREIAGGRNFSFVHDKWKDDSQSLTEELKQDFDKYKLRRKGN